MESPIQDYFRNSTVFITGGTGFLGSLLVEKLLRTCPGLKKVYILIRPKKGLTDKERYEFFFDISIFDKLKSEFPESIKKVFFMSGDCSVPCLGLSAESFKILIAEVNCMFHCAANINFREKFKISFNNNVGSVAEILKIGRNMKNLNSLIYVSTAFTNNLKLKTVHETHHSTGFRTYEQLQVLVDNLDDEFLEKHKAELICNCKNTYVITKIIAEEMIKNKGNGLPIAVVKPSMVTPTMYDPIPGWINNYYGIVGVFVVSVMGLVKVLLCNRKCTVDTVPADYVVNCLIASAWDISKMQNDAKKDEKHSTIKVFNCVSSPTNSITWGRYLNLLRSYYRKSPFSKQMAHNSIFITSNYYVYYILNNCFSFPLVYIMDLVYLCILQPTKFVTTYNKHSKFIECLGVATTNQFKFIDDSTQSLWEKLSKVDKITYNFDMTTIDWNSYCETCVKGIRTYVLRDSTESIKTALIHQRKLENIHNWIVFLLALFVILFLLYIYCS